MSYIGKNPKVDSVKLDGSATVPTGTSVEGQVYYNTGTGSISKGLKVYKNSQFVSIDKQLGDADTFHLLKASDISTAEFSAARNSTSTSFLNQNSVPFETTTASGVAGTFSNSSTGDALLTDESADLVFAYKSSGTSDDAQEYFGIPLSVPKAFRGENVVLSFQYRTGYGTGTTATVDGDFEVGILDKSTGNGGQTTSTNSTTDITAGSAITVASKTGLAVGQRIRLEAGSQSTIGNPDATVVEAYITEVSSTANEIKISEDWDTPHASGAVVVSGWLTDVVPGRLPAADSQTDKQGKNFSIQFKTEDDTSDIVLFFQNKNTSSTISRHLFVDNILLSANKFLQASSQTKNESYAVGYSADFWDTGTGTGGYLFDESMLLSHNGTPTLAKSNLITISDITGPGTTGTVTAIKAKQSISLTLTAGLDASATGEVRIYKNDGLVYGLSGPDGSVSVEEASLGISLSKDEYVYVWARNPASRAGYLSILAQPQTSDVIILENQDEIFTDWQDGGTLTIEGISSNPTMPATMYKNKIQYRRNGTNGHFVYQWYQNSASTSAGSGNYLISLPDGLSFDLSKVDVNNTAGTTTASEWNNEGIGWGTASASWSDADGTGIIVPYDATRFRVFYVRSTEQGIWGSGYFPLNSYTNFSATMEFEIPIAGWNSTFNPLLSMPLVELGTDVGYFNGYLNGGVGPGSSYRKYIDTTYIDTLSTSGLGTLTKGSSTAAFNFQASVDTIVTVNYTFGASTQIQIGPVFGASTNVTDSTIAMNSASLDGLRAGVVEQPGSSGQGQNSAKFPLKAGENFQMAQSTTGTAFSGGINSLFSITVERDRSNTTMAHVIKPAVAILSDEKSGTTNGGSSVSTGWDPRILNTVRGDSWFVTLTGTGTTGLGGTNDYFTLIPGEYELEAFAPFYNTAYTQLRLFNVTTQEITAVGTNNQTVANNGFINGPVYAKFTCTTDEQFTIAYRVSTAQANYGLGEDSTFSAAGDKSVFTQVKIRKLK